MREIDPLGWSMTRERTMKKNRPQKTYRLHKDIIGGVRGDVERDRLLPSLGKIGNTYRNVAGYSFLAFEQKDFMRARNMDWRNMSVSEILAHLCFKY